MKAFLILLLLSAGPVLSQTGKEVRSPEPYTVEPPALVEKEPRDTSTVYTLTDELAEFPGGWKEMDAFMNKYIRYPEKVAKRKVKGRCYLRFVVDSEGVIRNVEVMRGVDNCPECDQEAIRVIKMMPKWSPGKNSGKAVKSYFTLPVRFELF